MFGVRGARNTNRCLSSPWSTYCQSPTQTCRKVPGELLAPGSTFDDAATVGVWSIASVRYRAGSKSSVHFSDLHFLTGRHPGASVKSRLTAALGRVPKFAQGLAGHDPRAPRWLRSSIGSYFKRDAAEWSDKTELAFTGDLTTWGDDASLRGAMSFLETLRVDLGLPRLLAAYGNHDVWPGIVSGPLPWAETTANLGARRSAMRATHFRGTKWVHEVSYPTVPGGPTIGLCGVNTVLHCRALNTFAYGRIDEDFYWDPVQKSNQHQLAELTAWLNKTEVALILSHHPLYDPSTPTWTLPVGNALLNARDARSSLASAPSSNAVRIALSGHTHQVFPDVLHGSPPLERSMASSRQLTIGTCAQAPRPGTAPEQTWQAIEVSLDAAPGHVRMVRKVFARAGLGPFVPQPQETLKLRFR